MAIESECSTDIGPSHIIGEDTLLKILLKDRMRSPAISPLDLESSIFKVPQVLRRHNPKAYEPDVVSIGPYHRHRKQLRRMESVKPWYLQTVLNRLGKSVDEFIDNLMREKCDNKFGERAREFYAERLVHLSQSEFIGIMILDGCFIVQLLQNVVYDETDDPILKMDCMFQYICHDLLLLENQLPWFVLSTLYSVIRDSCPDSPSQFSEVLMEAFCSRNSLKKYFEFYKQHETGHKVDETGQKVDETDENQVRHILDLIRNFIVFKFQPFEPSRRNNKKWLCWFGEKEEEKTGLEIPVIPAATALSEAGVKFQRSSDNNLMNIEFKNGVLIIPELAFAELTEPLFRNLVAFEQCYRHRSHQITSYAFFMDQLINSDKDIELLSKEKILANWLNVEDGSKFFNSIYIDTTVKKFQYEKLCAQVNKYYHVRWNSYAEQFRRDHCSNPWKATAWAVGILILVLQFLQFIFRFLPSTDFRDINELSTDMYY